MTEKELEKVYELEQHIRLHTGNGTRMVKHGVQVFIPFLNRTIKALYIPKSTPLISMGQLVEDDFSIDWSKKDDKSVCIIKDNRTGKESQCTMKLDCPYLCMAQSSECPNPKEGATSSSSQQPPLAGDSSGVTHKAGDTPGNDAGGGKKGRKAKGNRRKSTPAGSSPAPGASHNPSASSSSLPKTDGDQAAVPSLQLVPLPVPDVPSAPADKKRKRAPKQRRPQVPTK